MNKRQLSYFVEVYNQKSYKKASDYFIVTPQGINKTIKLLEKELGCELFIQTNNGLMVTQEADELYPHAIAILKEFDMIEQKRADVPNKIVIYSIDGVMEVYLSDFLLEFYSKHPDISLKIYETTNAFAISQIQKNECDFAILQEEYKNEWIRNEVLFEAPFLLAVHKDSPLAKYDVIEDHDFSELRLAGRGFDYVVYDRTMSYLKKRGIKTITMLETNNSKLLIDFVANNFGACFLSEKSAALVNNENIKFIRIKNNIVNDRISIAYSPKIPPKAKVFLNELKYWILKNNL